MSVIYVLTYTFIDHNNKREYRKHLYANLHEAIERYKDLDGEWYANNIQIYKINYSDKDSITNTIKELL